ncbi:MAG: hypothetical protein IJ037_07150 [Clostridia bacterium]|nr:hypothetical protein [Clostridia bacterium]
MKTFAKRFFPIILMCLMVCTIFPTAAFAAEAACHFCGVTCSYTVDYEPWTDKVHCVRHWCSNCGIDMCGGVLGEDHSMSNGVCTLCGYDDGTGTPEPEPDPEPEVCYHYDTYRNRNGCDWSEYCSDCGEYLGSGTSHGSYSYGAWEYSSTSRHRRYYSCDDCGEGSYSYENHSAATEYSPSGSIEHKVGSYCSVCDSYIGSAAYESHNFTSGSWKFHDEARHRCTVSCDDCGYSTTEYENHADRDNDGECDSCGYGMSEFSVTVPAVMMLAVSETGEVTAADNAVIINNSSAAVVVSDITILSADGWTIVPYDTNMANEKVNANLIGFRIENIRTTDYGDSETFTGNWTLDSGDELSLDYDAVVSAASHAITDEQVLTVIFVIGWAA